MLHLMKNNLQNFAQRVRNLHFDKRVPKRSAETIEVPHFVNFSHSYLRSKLADDYVTTLNFSSPFGKLWEFKVVSSKMWENRNLNMSTPQQESIFKRVEYEYGKEFLHEVRCWEGSVKKLSRWKSGRYHLPSVYNSILSHLLPSGDGGSESHK